MERGELERQLADAEVGVSQALAHVERQKGLTAGFERIGDENGLERAKAMLATFEASLRLATERRDRLQRALDAAPEQPGSLGASGDDLSAGAAK